MSKATLERAISILERQGVTTAIVRQVRENVAEENILREGGTVSVAMYADEPAEMREDEHGVLSFMLWSALFGRPSVGESCSPRPVDWKYVRHKDGSRSLTLTTPPPETDDV